MFSTPKVLVSFELQQHSVAQQAQDLSAQQLSLLQSHLQVWLIITSPRVDHFQLGRRDLEGFVQHILD